jgi:hypothetical protein
MRSTLKILPVILALLALLIPITTFAQAPCPDDPELSANCDQEAPPFYVVINRDFEDLTRAGTGCQPIILNNPDCVDCCNEEDADCSAADAQVVTDVCPELATRVDWTTVVSNVVVYEMCCGCSTGDCDNWQYHVRLLQSDGTCPIDPDNPDCYEGLPPGTGIDLPAPVIIGGLAVIGLALLSVGVVLRRRSVRLA